MFNPSELEGEVDHTFFDSDCDSSSGHRRKKVEEGLKPEKENPAAPGRLKVKCTATAKADLSSSSDASGRHRNGLDNNNMIKARRKLSASATSCTSRNVSTDSSDSEKDSHVQYERPKGSLLALLTEARDMEDNVSSKSPDDTDEGGEARTSENSKKRIKHSPKKRTRSRHAQSPSPSSTEYSADADLESSCSSNSRRSSLESLTLPEPSKASLSPEVRTAGERSAASPPRQTTPADESDCTLTDVSPLSSPQSDPRRSLHPDPGEAEGRRQDEQREESVPSSGLSNIHEEDSDQDMDECSLSLESQLREKLVIHYPGRRKRKNFSFTNDEVWRKDRENQRLLRELSRLSPGSRSGSTTTKKSHVSSPSPVVRLPHSALNRQREQQRIERENLAILKRLQSVKPTLGLRRSEQLADYQRHAGYLGTPSLPVSMSAARKERSTVGSRVASSTTPPPRARKKSAARPAWC